MRKFIIAFEIIIIPVVFHNNLFAQWQHLNFAGGGEIQVLLTVGSNLYAGTDGGVFLSADSGNSWQNINRGIDNVNIHSLTSVNNGKYIFAGTDGGVFRSGDSGSTWQLMSNGLTNTSIFSLIADAGVILAGTDGGGVFRSTNNGTTWMATNSGMMDTIIRAFTISGNTVFAGAYSKGIFRSTDNGATWSSVDSGLLFLGTVPSVYSLAANDSMIFAGTYGGGMFRSTNNGATWAAMNNGITDPTLVALVLHDSSIYAASYTSGVFRSTDNGGSWISQSGSPSSVNVLAASGDIIYGATYTGLFLLTPDAPSWNPANGYLDYPYLNNFISIGNILLAATNSSGIFVSSDSGMTWMPADSGIHMSSGNLPAISSFALDGNIVFAGTSAGISRSTNAGTRWIPVDDSLFHTVNVSALVMRDSFIYVGTSKIYAGTNYKGIYISSNNGITWYGADSGLTEIFVTTLAAHGTEVVAGTRDSGIFFSSDNGKYWSAENNGLLQSARYFPNIFSLTFKGDTLFAGTDYGAFRTTDNGANWTPQDSGLTYQIQGIPPYTVYTIITHGDVLFAATDFGVFISTNNGATWESINNGIGDYIRGPLFIFGGYIYGGSVANIWRRPLAQILSGVDEHNGNSAIPKVYVLRNYPNPFDKLTNIEFHIPNYEPVTLTVYNTIGQEVAALVNGMQSAGTHIVQFFVDGLPGGDYYYRLNAGQYSQTGVMAILHK